MVRSFLLSAFLILAVGGLAAEEPKAAEQAPGALPLTTTLAKDYPVITVEGCAKPAPAKMCKTIITRQEFEALVNGINPRMTKLERRQLAENYGRMLALSNEALREGIDKKPEMTALLHYVRTNALGGGAYKQVQREVGERSEPDLEKFYKANQASYDRYTLQRLFIPAVKQQQAGNSLEQVAASGDEANTQQEMKALAEQIRTRAAAGEGFKALQKEIDQRSGLPGDPQVDVVDALRGTLPQNQNQIFDLPAGTTSSIIEDSNGYYIYKVVSKKTPRLEDVRDQVAIEMENQRTAAALKKIERMKVDDAYFEKYDPPAPRADEPEVDDD